MPAYMHLLQQLHADVLSCTIPDSAKALVKRFEPLTVGMRLKAPILLSGARLFRIRRMNNIPLNIAEVGAPPTGVAPIGRVNDKGQSVLYLADSPDTAFAAFPNGEFNRQRWYWRMVEYQNIYCEPIFPTILINPRI